MNESRGKRRGRQAPWSGRETGKRRVLRGLDEHSWRCLSDRKAADMGQMRALGGGQRDGGTDGCCTGGDEPVFPASTRFFRPARPPCSSETEPRRRAKGSALVGLPVRVNGAVARTWHHPAFTDGPPCSEFLQVGLNGRG